MTTQDDVCIISRDNKFAVGNLVKKIKSWVRMLCFLFRKLKTFGELMVKRCRSLRICTKKFVNYD